MQRKHEHAPQYAKSAELERFSAEKKLRRKSAQIIEAVPQSSQQIFIEAVNSFCVRTKQDPAVFFCHFVGKKIAGIGIFCRN